MAIVPRMDYDAAVSHLRWAPASNPVPNGYDVELFKIPLEYYVVCWAGAVVLFFRLRSDGRPVIEFLHHLAPHLKGTSKARIFDFVTFSIVGAFLGTVLTQPTTVQQALAAGLGWTGLIAAFSKAGGGDG